MEKEGWDSLWDSAGEEGDFISDLKGFALSHFIHFGWGLMVGWT